LIDKFILLYERTNHYQVIYNYLVSKTDFQAKKTKTTFQITRPK